MDQPIAAQNMNLSPNASFDNLLISNREAEFLSLFEEEEASPSTKKEILIPPIIKSLDSIILNLSEAVKTAIYWDDYVRKNDVDIMEMFKGKSSVMLKVVDYLTDSQPNPITTNSQLTLFYPCNEKRQSCEVIKIFANLLKTFSTVLFHPLIKIQIQNFEPKILEMKNPLPYEIITVWGRPTNRKSSALMLDPLTTHKRNFLEIDDVQREKPKLIIDPNEQEVDSENFYDASQCFEESICDEIIANLKTGNSVKHALSLLDDLMKETEKNKKKRPLTPKKIKESLHKLNDVFGLLEKQTATSFDGKQKKCFSDVLKLLENLTNVVKIRLKEEFAQKKSSPENLQREIMETFELLANYSEKAKRLIKEFKMKNKGNYQKDVGYDSVKTYGSVDSYFV